MWVLVRVRVREGRGRPSQHTIPALVWHMHQIWVRQTCVYLFFLGGKVNTTSRCGISRAPGGGRGGLHRFALSNTHVGLGAGCFFFFFWTSV